VIVKRNWLPDVPRLLSDSFFPILLAIVISIITDIDTPRAGLIAVAERPLLEINETLSRPVTQTTS
jgi:hypothetical protein